MVSKKSKQAASREVIPPPLAKGKGVRKDEVLCVKNLSMSKASRDAVVRLRRDGVAVRYPEIIQLGLYYIPHLAVRPELPEVKRIRSLRERGAGYKRVSLTLSVSDWRLIDDYSQRECAGNRSVAVGRIIEAAHCARFGGLVSRPSREIVGFRFVHVPMFADEVSRG